jgi:hypothetical protein
LELLPKSDFIETARKAKTGYGLLAYWLVNLVQYNWLKHAEDAIEGLSPENLAEILGDKKSE